jgi:hypothetical protein
MAARTDPGLGFCEEVHTFRVSVRGGRGVSRRRISTFAFSPIQFPKRHITPVFLYINAVAVERGAMNQNGVKTVQPSL